MMEESLGVDPTIQGVWRVISYKEEDEIIRDGRNQILCRMFATKIRFSANERAIDRIIILKNDPFHPRYLIMMLDGPAWVIDKLEEGLISVKVVIGDGKGNLTETMTSLIKVEQ